MKPAIVFAHGAGAGSSHPWMRNWAARLEDIGSVFTFDYDYVKSGRKRPDMPAALLATHAEAIRQACTRSPGAPLVLAGKSMGSRMGCHLAVHTSDQGNDADIGGRLPSPSAIVCFGYPLRSASSGASRADILRQLRVPILFVQGTRDPLCPLDELHALLPTLAAPTQLHVVDGGDHSLLVGKRALAAVGLTQPQVDEQIAKTVGAFLQRWVPGAAA